MEIYVHRSGEERMQLQEVDSSATVAEAAAVADGESVWLEDAEAPLDPSRTLAEAGITERDHVHVNRCHHVAVSVTYNGASKSSDFPAPAKIRRVLDWVTGKKGFDVSNEDKAELALQLCGTSDRPDLSDHVGSFTSEESCDVCFELVPKQVIQG